MLYNSDSFKKEFEQENMKSMLLKRNLTVLLLLLFVFANVFAQSKSISQITINSTPKGASVTLKGDMIITGVSPTIFNIPLSGSYEIEVVKEGYEKYSSTIYLTPNKPMVISVVLKRKTKAKASLRSIFVPGWGQRYFDQKKKGNFFTLLSAGAVASYLIIDSDFDDKYQDFIDLDKEYKQISGSNGGNISDLRALKLKVDESRRVAFNAEDNRRIAIGSIIAVWSLNVLDAWFLSPEKSKTFGVDGLTLIPETNLSDSFGIKIAASF